MFKRYKSFIDEYIFLGQAKIISLQLSNPKSALKYFLQHHCIIRDLNETTKFRIVFDASMETKRGLALNDILLKGFKIQPDLFDNHCRFRLFPFVLITDIKNVHCQIKITPDQRFLQNILWRDNLSRTYGTTCICAPYLATILLFEIANENKNKYLLAANVKH